jgi:flagellar hook protein FlgE
MGLQLNLDSSAAVGATVTAPVQVYDSLGVSHDLTVTYTNTGAGTWSYAVTVPPADITGAPTTPVATGTLSFDANGNLTGPLPTSDPQTIDINNLSDGANNLTINWNLYNQTGPTPVGTITQYDAASTVTSSTQNGYAAGSVSGIALQNGGTVMATYTNGQQVAIGQLAVASIANPSSLSAVGDNNLAVTANTSTPVVGAANTGGRGQIQAGALESSTVDIATEFANLLTFERGYQADSRVITTSDQLDQETINLIPQS